MVRKLLWGIAFLANLITFLITGLLLSILVQHARDYGIANCSIGVLPSIWAIGMVSGAFVSLLTVVLCSFFTSAVCRICVYLSQLVATFCLTLISGSMLLEAMQRELYCRRPEVLCCGVVGVDWKMPFMVVAFAVFSGLATRVQR